MKFLVVFFTFFFVPACFPNESLNKIYLLAEEARGLSIKLSPIPENFNIDTQIADVAYSLSKLENDIAEYAFNGESDEQNCNISDERNKLQNLIKDRKNTLLFSLRIGDKAKDTFTKGYFGNKELDTYTEYFAYISNQKSLIKEFKSFKLADQTIKKGLSGIRLANYNSLTPAEKAKRMADYANSKYGTTTTAEMFLANYAYDEIINNDADWKKTLHAVKDNLSFKSKIILASKFLKTFENNYDYKRLDLFSDAGKGAISTDELFQAAKDKTPKGICRDYALANNNILSNLGIPKDNLYIATFATASGYHANNVVIDPSNPNNIIKMDYNYISDNKGTTGSDALTQVGSPDTGIHFRIYNADGSPVAKIPSALGNILADATDKELNETQIIPAYSLKKVAINTKYGNGTLFTGTTSTGDIIVGAAISKKGQWKYGTIEGATAITSREGDRGLATIDQQALYARLKTELNSPTFKKNKFGIRTKTGIEIESLLMKNEERFLNNDKKNDSYNLDVSEDLYLGVESKYTSTNKKIELKSDITAHSYIASKNISNAELTEMTPVLDRIEWNTSLNANVTNDIAAIAYSTLAIREIGSTASIKIGVKNKNEKIEGTVGYQTPLDRDAPKFLPYADNLANVSVEKEFNNFCLALEYTKNLDTNTESGTAAIKINW